MAGHWSREDITVVVIPAEPAQAMAGGRNCAARAAYIVTGTAPPDRLRRSSRQRGGIKQVLRQPLNICIQIQLRNSANYFR